MPKILVRGSQNPLVGKIKINGSKNSALPIITASLLTSSAVTLFNVPDLTDVHIMCKLLDSLGAKVKFVYNKDYRGNHTLEIDCSSISNFMITHKAASELRASVLILGPLLSRFGKVSTVHPGGCKIGARPVDFHIKALEEMGGKIEDDGCRITAITENGKLQGGDIAFEKVSVGATQNIIMAATLADGVTTIKNAAVEPEVIDLIDFLQKMGADISVNDRTIAITGVQTLKGCSHKIIPDRIEAGTYALAALITNGRLELEGINLSDIRCFADELDAVGCKMEPHEEGIIISRKKGHALLRSTKIATNLYPKFSTDMQAQFMAAMSTADGISVIEENIYENRFMHVNELRKLGARIGLEDNKATIHGVKRLFGADLCATDLRATAALLLASLTAHGETSIQKCDYLLRGYEAMPEKLRDCGADICLSILD